MKQFNCTPELNYWMRIVLANSPVGDVFYRIPVEVSDSWRCPNSVIELLFNENFNPDPAIWLQSSSSSSGVDPWIQNIRDQNDKRYIYKYRRCNLNSITDKKLMNRLQIYRWNCNVFVANHEQFLNLLDMTGSLYDSKSKTSEVFMPIDVEEKDRSPYITYQARTYFSTNYPLNYTPDGLVIPPPVIPPIIVTDENLFNFTDQDLEMLDLLYDYKVGYAVDIIGIDYTTLLTPISKLIYIYLDAMLSGSFIHYNNLDVLENDFLSSLYEKHVLGILYTLQQKTYCVNWNEQVIINEKLVRLDEDMLMKMKVVNFVLTVSQDDVDTSQIIVADDENLPWNRKDVTIFKEGRILEQDKDYKVIIDRGDVRQPFIRIEFFRNILVVNEPLTIIWASVEPHSAWSDID